MSDATIGPHRDASHLAICRIARWPGCLKKPAEAPPVDRKQADPGPLKAILRCPLPRHNRTRIPHGDLKVADPPGRGAAQADAVALRQRDDAHWQSPVRAPAHMQLTPFLCGP
ncbi:hypothetical protein ROA7023_00421 [Roseisalinus antarcticus]|uniref:Uncharacterized protein n=1 Tax=Roseisalinus antarcticus TaxID=254357 RepID=A0A1Y5RJA9_9RHOB|nr:hypothetical protein ROA7023_00421 [Roseisalinus antarcticus]